MDSVWISTPSFKEINQNMYRNCLFALTNESVFSVAGIPPDKMVEAHGTFSSATCMTCRQKYNGEEIKVTLSL